MPSHRCEIFVTDVLGVPLPPLHRLFAGYFARTCSSDEFLLNLERRRFTPDDLRQVIERCPGAGDAAAGETPETRL